MLMVMYFFKPPQKKGKFFMIMVLNPADRDFVIKAGGFDKLLATAGWIEGEALQGKLKFAERSCFIFRHHLEFLDFIRDQLAKKLEQRCLIKNIHATPTFAQLLAKNHLAKDVGFLNIYINHELPLKRQHDGLLWGTYRAKSEADYREFSRECKSRWPYVKVEFWATDVIVVRGYFQSGFAWLQSYLNEYKGFSMGTNILDVESYPMLLLRDAI